jgi:hypothetical protein
LIVNWSVEEEDIADNIVEWDEGLVCVPEGEELTAGSRGVVVFQWDFVDMDALDRILALFLRNLLLEVLLDSLKRLLKDGFCSLLLLRRSRKEEKDIQVIIPEILNTVWKLNSQTMGF